MKTTLIDKIDPRLAAQVRAQAIERGEAVAKPATKPKAKPAAPADVSRAASTSMSTFAHLLQSRAPEPPAASSGTRRPALTREQSAALAKRIVAAHNKARGLVSGADKARAEAKAQANMTPLARQIIDVARRVGLA